MTNLPKPEATPFDTVAIDFITKLPESQGYNSILTITDHNCTKAAIFIPCNEEINAEETAALYIKHVFIHFGLPSKIISDRDPRFASKFTRELCKIVGIEQNISTAYHPQTDRQSERTNQWLETFLCFVTDYRQHDWALHLPMAQFVHNNWPSDTTRKSPFFLRMGYDPCADWHNTTSPLPQVTLCLEQLKEAQDNAQALMIKAQWSWVKHKDTPKYKEGDLVWLEGRNLRLSQPTPKLAPRRHGPFKVVQVMSPVNYHLELPMQWSIHPVFHIDLLTPYHETITHGPNYQCPPPDLVDNEEEYKVKKILDSWQFGRCKHLQYLVKWKGYPDSDNMWVDKDDIFADDKVWKFKALNPNARTHIRCLWKDGIPQFSLAPSSSPSSSYLPLHTTHMSDNGSDAAYEPRLSALKSPPTEAGLQSPRPTGVTNASEIAAAFSRMSLGPPPVPTIKSDKPQGLVTLQVPQHAVTWNVDSSSMATRTAVVRTDPAGRMEQGPSGTRHDSDQSDYKPDLRPCPRGCGPMEYCHGHKSPSPTPIPAPQTPLPIRPPTTQQQGVASFQLNGEDATVLATQLLCAFGEDHEDAIEVPPAYPVAEAPAQGMGV